jgi:hypothetical protein
MKTQIKSYFFLFLITLFFASCQDEVVQLNEPDAEEVIVANSVLSNLMLRTSANAVSEDNVIDNTSCFSVALPVTVIVGNITITIENQEGIDDLEELLENFEDEIPEFVFPITIIDADYTETVIENQDQLEALLEDCIDDDVIECVDFVYPISFSVLNAEFVIIDTVTIEDNEALYEFLENLDNDDVNLVSLNFPVTLVYASGETIEVNSNTELSDAISSVDEDCDDDDFENCDVDEIRQSLKECKWEIEIYTSFPVFEGFELEFNEDFTFDIIIDNNQVLSEGNSWELIEDGDFVYLVLSTDFEDLGGNWKVVECDDDELYLTKDDQAMQIEQYCETDLNCSAEDLSNDLVECFWFAGTSLLNNQDNKFVFTEEGTVKLYTNNEFIEIGTWNISVDVDGLTLVLNLTGNYEVLSGNWDVVECNEGFYGLSKDDNILHLEQECFDDNPFECFESFDAIIELCDEGNDGYETFDLTIAFANCTPSADVVTYHTSIADADSNLNPIANPQSFINSTTPQTIYVRVEVENDFEVFELLLKLEDCGNGFCTEGDVDGILMNCEWKVTELNGDDNLITYRLDFNDGQELIITNTENDDTVTSFWSTETNNDGGVDVTFDGISAPNIQAISGIWTVVECTGEQLIFHRDNDQMTLDKICD